MSDLVLFEEVPAVVAGACPPGPVAPGSLLTITAYGDPGPQGSKRHVGGGRMLESSALVKPWRDVVAWRAIEARAKLRGWTRLTGPVVLSLVFTLPRPKDHFGTGRNAGVLRTSAPARPDVRPDLDKLARSTLDALKTGGIYRDDGQVVEFCRLAKFYSTDHGQVLDVLDVPGCVIRVWALPTAAEGADS